MTIGNKLNQEKLVLIEKLIKIVLERSLKQLL